MGCKISNVECYLPERILSNSELEKIYSGWSAEKIESKTGIKERRVCGENETALDLALGACSQLFKKFDKYKIDFVLLCTQSPEYLLPTTACILQDRLGLKKDIGALDFNLGCSGYIYGLALAKSLINTQIASCVLLVMAESYTKYIHPMDKSNRTIFGDAAAASIIERSEEEHILEFVLGTDGSGYNNLIVPNGGLRNRYNIEALEETDETGAIRTQNNIYMNGPEIFNFTLNSIPAVYNNILLKNNMTIENIDYVIFHQANKYMLDYLRKKIKIPEEKFYSDMLLTGNTVSVTIPIALEQSLKDKILKPNDIVMLVGFGVGYSWGATIIKI
jgi:3-oxoacyl-[acyl-carrier-protein] synthase III